MSSQVTLKAVGLNFSPNNLSLPQGSLLQGDNIIIRRDDVVESRRGIKRYSEGLGLSIDRAKQLIEYKDRILVNYAEKLAFDTGLVDSDGREEFSDFSGSYAEASAGLRIKALEANKNLYFTTSEGIKRISARTADDFTTDSGFIREAGAVQALDFSAALDITQGQTTGFLPSDSAVAYRVVWGYKDLNETLVLGVPSDRVIVYNFLTSQMSMDLNQLCLVLDELSDSVTTTANISDGDYATEFFTPANSDGEVYLNNVLQLATKLDEDIQLADQGGSAPLDMDTIVVANSTCTITFDSGDPSQFISEGDYLFLSDFQSTFSVVNGAQLITDVTSTTISFVVETTTIASETVTGAATIESYNYRHITSTGDIEFTQPLDELTLSVPATTEQLRTINNNIFRISERLKAELDGVIPTAAQTAYVTPFLMTERANVLLNITIPSQIDSQYFFQVYRTRTFTAEGEQTLGDSGAIPVVPDDEMRLVYEAFPTSVEISAGSVEFLDNYPEELIQNNANLYTNPETGDGILQANYQPPFALDINTFKNCTFYANTKTKYQIPILQLLGVSNILDGDTLTISNGTDTQTYTFRQGVVEITDIILTGATGLTGGEYFTIYSANDAKIYDIYYVINGSGSAPVNAGHTPIPVNLPSGYSDSDLTIRTMDVLNTLVYDFFTEQKSTYTFTLSPAASADAGAVYTNNGELFTVDTTIAAGPSLATTGIHNPFASGTLTKVSGIGDDEISFTSFISSAIAQLRVTNTIEGITTNASAETSTFTISTYQNGDGEDAANKQFLLSSLVSAAQAIDETARSIVRVINKQNDSPIYAYYISGDNTPPGQINLKNKDISDPAFYLITSTVDAGLSFNPDISPENLDITSASITYEFTVSGANATAGAVYTNNGESFTVVNTIAGGTTLLTTATGAPTGSGTLTLFSGSGDATITFSAATLTDTIVTTSNPHGLSTGDTIIIGASNSTPTINGVWEVIVTSTTTFTIDEQLTVAGSTGVWTKTTDIEYATNEIRKNRVYFSKLNQPDAVPLLNYLNVGAEDKEILRIIPLRDSLFVFKEDGLYRISGETAPFVLASFDLTCRLLAPDSIGTTNNEVYGWSESGIIKVNETGVSDIPISRPIDSQILKLGSSSYPNFRTLTWGIGYDSDNTYTVYTNLEPEDEHAVIGFTYNTLTNTWTNVTREQTCGIVLSSDDKLYMGNANGNFIDKERKSFDRTDYADDDFNVILAGGQLTNNNTTIKLASVDGIEVGDVLTQEQTLTIYLYNKLLRELDTDPSVQDDNYFETLEAVPGDILRDKIEELATKLDQDPNLDGDYFDHIDNKSGGINSNSKANPTVIVASAAHELVNGRVVTILGTQTPESDPSIEGIWTVNNTGTFGVSTTFEIPVNVITAGGSGLTFDTQPNENNFQDIKACFNIIVQKLNSDPGAAYSTYKEVSGTTLMEAIIVDVNTITKRITTNIPQEWVVGSMTVYEAIEKTLVFAPETMGDALMSKQVREATVMLDSTAISFFNISFASDLIPKFYSVEFNGLGNGIFGSYSSPGFGHGFFGGAGNSAPFRTLVPLNIQRCRYILVGLEHSVARESFILYGVTLTGDIGKSVRAYR